MRCVVAFLILFSPSLLFSLPEAEFLSPFYARPESARLQARLAELRVQSNLHAHLATQLIELHLYLLALEEGRPHQAASLLTSLGELCDFEAAQGWATYRAQSELRARAAYLCAWVNYDRMDASALARFTLRSYQATALAVAREESLSATERSYLEARLGLAAPPGMGRDVRGALVKLVLLETQLPENFAIRNALARAYVANGSPAGAEERKLTPDREWVDVPTYGFGAGLFASPSSDLGVAFMAQDQRLFDRNRLASATLSGSLRNSLSASLHYEDGELFSGVRLDASAGWSRELRDYFPLGIDSLSAARTRNLTTVWSGEVGASVAVAADVGLRVAWRGESRRVEETPFIVENETLSRALSYSGPVGELYFDNRDSARDPWRGLEVRARGHFPSEGLGSPVTFERWDFLGAYHLMLTRLHHLHFHASLSSAGGTAPLAAYPYLGGLARLPGVRSDRFRDHHSLAGFIEYQLHTRGPIRAAAFAVAGRVAPSLSDLFGRPGAGGGLALILQNSRERSTPLRVELGQFKSEWSFQITLATAW